MKTTRHTLVGLGLAATLLLAGCAAAGGGAALCVRFGAEAVCPVPPRAIEPPHSLWQLEIEHGQKQANLLLDVEADASSLQLVGLTPLGQKLMHLKYGEVLEVIARPPAGVDAATLLVLVQRALWPAGTFTETPEISVSLRDGKVRLGVPARGLVLTLTRLEAP